MVTATIASKATVFPCIQQLLKEFTIFHHRHPHTQAPKASPREEVNDSLAEVKQIIQSSKIQVRFTHIRTYDLKKKNVVVSAREMPIVTLALYDNDGGCPKFEMTPGGGLKAGTGEDMILCCRLKQ